MNERQGQGGGVEREKERNERPPGLFSPDHAKPRAVTGGDAAWRDCVPQGVVG